MSEIMNTNTRTPEQIVYIEYHRHGRQWLPHAVVSHGKLNEQGRTNYSHFDFDYCLDGSLVYSDTGGGPAGDIDLPIWCDAPKLCCKIWHDPSKVKLKAHGKLATVESARKLGNVLLSQPIGDNPFDHAIEEGTEYCNICGGHYPSDSTCRHLKYEEGCGHTLGCGAGEVDLLETQTSLYRFLRTRSGEDVDSLLKSLSSKRLWIHTMDSMLGGNMTLYIDPHGPTIYCEPYGEEHRYEERYWPGIAWLLSLDKKASHAVALTRGWVWGYQNSSWRAGCVLPERTFYREVSRAVFNKWMAVDPLRPGLLEELPFKQSLRFKTQTKNCMLFKTDPKNTSEIVLHIGSSRTYKSITFSVAEVKQRNLSEVEIIFGRILDRDGKHCSTFKD